MLPCIRNYTTWTDKDKQLYTKNRNIRKTTSTRWTTKPHLVVCGGSVVLTTTGLAAPRISWNAFFSRLSQLCSNESTGERTNVANLLKLYTFISNTMFAIINGVYCLQLDCNSYTYIIVHQIEHKGHKHTTNNFIYAEPRGPTYMKMFQSLRARLPK